jgi:ABC-type lipoprotein release transport system permease subunit
MGLQKHTNLAGYALGNVLKHKTKTIALLIALISSTFLLASTEFIREGVVRDVSSSLEEGPDVIVQRLVGGRQVGVPQDWVENVTTTAGVQLASPRVWGYSDIGTGSLLTVMGVNATDYEDAYGSVGTNILEGGRFLRQNDTHKMVVGKGIVDLMAASRSSFQVEVGSNLSLISYDGRLINFQIVGIFTSESKIFSYDLILTDLESARSVIGVENSTFTDIAVWTELGAPLNDVAFRLDNKLPEGRILTRDGISDSLLKVYGGRAGIIALLWATILAIVVLLALTVSSGGSDESRREVGLLKALGFDTVDVIEIRMFESTFVGLLGGSIGLSASIIFDFLLGAPLLSGYLLGWNLILLNGGIPLSFSPQILFIVYAMSVIPILVATVLPAWRNAIIEPDSVLRGV